MKGLADVPRFPMASLLPAAALALALEVCQHPVSLSAAEASGGGETAAFAVPLPPGVRAVWNLDRAHREATPTRERVSLNGLWRWQPRLSTPGTRPYEDSIPQGGWGYFKVPGSWPGIEDYMQKDCQTVFAHPDWRDRPLREVAAAWYEREFSVPAEWADRLSGGRVEGKCSPRCAKLGETSGERESGRSSRRLGRTTGTAA